MQPAVEGMSKFIANLSFQNPSIAVIGNTGARPVTTAGEVKSELLNQLCNPVQWIRTIQYMVDNGVTTFIEIGPGKVLTGLVKRINRDVKTVNIGDLEAVKSLSNPSP